MKEGKALYKALKIIRKARRKEWREELKDFKKNYKAPPFEEWAKKHIPHLLDENGNLKKPD